VKTVTILMPVFNERATLEAAIAGALEADLPTDRTDLIVIDDGSTDGSREVLASTDWPANVPIDIHEVPISYSARAREEGKKLEARDGLRVLRTLLRCRFDGTANGAGR
jgi:Glycosyl transferase family 2